MSRVLDSRVIIAELAEFLHVSSVGVWSLREYETLHQYLQDSVGSAGGDHDLAAVIFAAAMLPATEVYEQNRHGQKIPRWPLRAAKHLLALGEYPDDENEIIAEIGRSKKGLQKGDKGIKNLEPLTSNSLRHRMAMIAGGYAETRRSIQEREPEIAYALMRAIKQVLDSPDRKALIRLTRQQMKDAEARLASQESARPGAPAKVVAKSPTIMTAKPHLASNGEDPMGLPRLLAPHGQTYQRWMASGPESEPLKIVLWADRKPRELEMFLLHDASQSSISTYSLHRDPFIRLLMERFHGETYWNSGYGPLPVLEAIQERIEEKFARENRNASLAISLAQAVFLGRLILDPRRYDDDGLKIRRHRPKSEHFGQVWAEWADADIVRNYRRWIVDTSMDMDPDCVDWGSRVSGARGGVTPYRVQDVVTDLVRVADLGLIRIGKDAELFPTLQALMYEYGYDIMSRAEYRRFIIKLSQVCPEHAEWWDLFFDISARHDEFHIHDEVWPRLLFKMVFSRGNERLKASVDWAYFSLALGIRSSVRQLSNPVSRVAQTMGFDYGTRFM
jgi:hypothetical protein